MARIGAPTALGGRQPQAVRHQQAWQLVFRRMFVHGARAVLLRVKYDTGGFGRWVHQLEARTVRNKVIVAVANKLARITWAVLSKAWITNTRPSARCRGKDASLGKRCVDSRRDSPMILVISEFCSVTACVFAVAARRAQWAAAAQPSLARDSTSRDSSIIANDPVDDEPKWGTERRFQRLHTTASATTSYASSIRPFVTDTACVVEHTTHHDGEIGGEPWQTYS